MNSTIFIKMTSNIHFGNIKTKQGKATINDVASTGLDIQNLIKAELYGKEEKIKKVQDVIDLGTKKLTSFMELREILCNLNASAAPLYNKNDSGLHESVFDKRVVSVNNSDSSLPSTYIEAKSNSKVPEGEYEIHVNNLTSFQCQTSNGFLNNNSDITGFGLNNFGVGTFEINGQPINIVAGDSLGLISNKINETQSLSQVKSYCMKVAPNNYVLVLKAAKPGTDNSFTITDPNNILLNVLFTDSPAQDADFTFNDIPMSRSSNIVEDVIEGMTINMRRPMGQNINSVIEVTLDYDAIMSQIYIFVEEYNKFMDFYHAQTAKKDVKKNEYDEKAILHKEKILFDIKEKLQSFLVSKFRDSSNSKYPSLSSIGIDPVPVSKSKTIEGKQTYSFSDKVELSIDELRKALLQDFEGVKNLLGINYQSSSQQFALNRVSSNISKNNFQLRVDCSPGVLPTASFSYLNNNQNVTVDAKVNKSGSKNLLIIGPSGSAVDGLEILYLYNNVATDQTDINLSVGLMPKICYFLDEILSTNGKFSLKSAEEVISDDLEKKEEENTENKKALETQEELLIKKYSKVQAAIDKYDKQLSALKSMDEERRAR